MTEARSPQVKTAAVSASQSSSYAALNGEGIELAEELAWDDRLYEIVNGERVEKPMASYVVGIANDLGYRVEHHARTGQLGRAYVEQMFVIDAAKRLERRPDVAFVSYQRWPKKRRLPQTNAVPVVPDLAAEVVCRTNLAKGVVAKVEEDFRAGVRLVWVVYPDLNQVYVYELPTNVRVLHQTDELDGGTVLPGFRIKVAALFEDELGAEEAEPAKHLA